MIAFLFCVLFALPVYADSPQSQNVIAVIGDYGSAGPDEAAVAALVKSWSPEAVLTVGDNNYEAGSADTIDANIGQYYQEYIYPYQGSFGKGAPDKRNHFYPVLGNHDWAAGDTIQPYLAYFKLPGNGRYYDFQIGPIHFFALDSCSREPDDITPSGIQGQWLHRKLSCSQAPFKIVFFHHTPYSSKEKPDATPRMRWPFKEWGASAVLSGHNHVYERVIIEGFPYFTNGLGGESLYPLGTPISGSESLYNADYGAMRILATPEKVIFEFYSVSEGLIDSYAIAPLQKQKKSLLDSLTDWYLCSLESNGYPLVILLMAMESSFFPLPSEVVILPAAYLVCTNCNMSILGISLAGAIGSWLGSSLMYALALLFGRPFILRYGTYILLPPKKLEAAERWAEKFGSIGVFVSRFLPVIRHIIGIPAGVVRMNYLKFSLYTFLGSFIWCGILTWTGVMIARDMQQEENVVQTLSLWLGGLALVMGTIYYFFVHRHMRK